MTWLVSRLTFYTHNLAQAQVPDFRIPNSNHASH